MPALRSTVLALSLLIGLAASGHAQAAESTLAPGARVRVRQGDQSMIGTLVSLDGAGLVIATGKSDTVTVPRASITTIDVSIGTKAHAGKGALIGLGVGTVTGILVGIAASGSDNGDLFDFNAGEWAAGVGLAVATGKSDTVTVPRTSITAIDVSTGTKSHAGKGALIGLGVGALTGVIVGIAASSSDNGDFIDFSAGEWAVGAGLTGAVIGTGLGALIGAGTRLAIGLRIRF